MLALAWAMPASQKSLETSPRCEGATGMRVGRTKTWRYGGLRSARAWGIGEGVP